MLAIAIVANTVLDGSNATLAQNDAQKQQPSTRDKSGSRRSGDAISEVHKITVRAPAPNPAMRMVSIIVI